MRWPSEASLRARLRSAALPCLLLVEAAASLPADLDADDEDWVRLPASDADITARSRQLGLRFSASIRLEDAVLHTGHGTVALSAGEAAVLAVLLQHRFAVTPRTTLLTSLGLTDADTRRLHRTVHRLRGSLRAVGLDVFPARGRGYSLGLTIVPDPDPDPDPDRDRDR
ncbi:MAG: winged helix-turn-helix domain-containing protein [Acidimicrobiales bacterium]|nr:winged helix-turn-helix domain-containing protein [Acidimicrobiales bacterium]